MHITWRCHCDECDEDLELEQLEMPDDGPTADFLKDVRPGDIVPGSCPKCGSTIYPEPIAEAGAS